MKPGSSVGRTADVIRCEEGGLPAHSEEFVERGGRCPDTLVQNTDVLYSIEKALTRRKPCTNHTAMYFGLPDQFQRCCAASGHGSEAELEELRERQRGALHSEILRRQGPAFPRLQEAHEC